MINFEYVQQVRNIAAKKHANPGEFQRYGSAPYSKHLDDVYHIGLKFIHLVEEQYRENVLCALPCHDLIEDTDMDINEIEKFSSREVAELVFLVSNERGRNRKERNFKTYPKIWNNELAIFIKLCDRIANTQNSKSTGHRMYTVYKKEYPVFRYALKGNNFLEMWQELDKINDWNEK